MAEPLRILTLDEIEAKPGMAAANAAMQAPAWRGAVLPLIEATEVTGVGYRMSRKQAASGKARIWRALLLPKYVPEIRAWCRSSLRSANP